MGKIVKIETGVAAQPAAGCGEDMARLTFADGETTFVSTDAFPSIEVMVKDATDEECFINLLLTASRDMIDEQNSGAFSVPEWTTIYTA